MKRKLVSTAFAFFLCCCAASAATLYAQGTVVKDPKPKPVLLKPDLTISEVVWRSKPHTAIIVVANIGTVKSVATTGGYSCKTAPDKNGYAITAGTQFYLPGLLPNQRKRIILDCKGSKLLNASVDGGEKVDESNESNNEIDFAEAQK
jgi:hypothetical protein